MNIYTKGGDKGTTSLVHTKNVSKSDDRIQLVGTIDELTSHIGLVKSMLTDPDMIQNLEKIQSTLITLMAGIADPYKRDYRISDEETSFLEAEIDRLEGLFDRPKKFILPGGSRLSAETDVARTVARRGERVLAAVSVKFGADNGAKKYMNRLADYLYVLARYIDAREMGQTKDGASGKEGSADKENLKNRGNSMGQMEMPVSEAVIQEVLKRMGIQGKITLDSAKRLIEAIEQEAQRRGKKAVIAVCGPDGNPIAVHVMDGAFLVSFDVAIKKAYTSVAVKMTTMELSALAQPGGTFYGLDKMDNGKIVIFGGGVPLKVGDTIIGGLGVSGGTGEEDHSLAEYGLSILDQVL
ncbi:MAG: cob(I)yrinic acid a,c-diamide adenosyltransferase [Blautia sp.]|nr:cob(I)yrinic acid a,c-diamide adenosyltransferase [Blautia sp.]